MTESTWGGKRPNTGPKRRRLNLDPQTAHLLAELVASWREHPLHTQATPEDVVSTLIRQEHERWQRDG